MDEQMGRHRRLTIVNSGEESGISGKEGHPYRNSSFSVRSFDSSTNAVSRSVGNPDIPRRWGSLGSEAIKELKF